MVSFIVKARAVTMNKKNSYILIILTFSIVFIFLLPKFKLFNNALNNEVILIDRQGSVTVEKNSALKSIITDMDRKAELDQFKEDNIAGKFNSVWDEILSNMSFPEPGNYPVIYYTPHNNVPLIGTMHDRKPLPVWIDNQHVAYWAGISEEYPIKQRPLFSEYELVILNVESGKVISKVAKQEKNIFSICFYKNNNNFLYILDKDTSKPFEGTVFIEGKFDSKFSFYKNDQSFIGTRDKLPYFNEITCEILDKELYLKTNLKPGEGVAIIADRDNGVVKHIPRVSSKAKEINLNFKVNGPIKYDHVKDQYYLGATFSKEDQRTKFFYFDREFNLVETFTLPRVYTHTRYPSSTLAGASSPPLKDGFITYCNYKNGEQIVPYLCHVKKSQDIILAVKGYAKHYATSPDGCRVFGFVTQDKKDFSSGKNFMLDVCK